MQYFALSKDVNVSVEFEFKFLTSHWNIKPSNITF